MEQGTLKVSGSQMYIILYPYVVTRKKGTLEVGSMERSCLAARKMGNAYTNINIYVSIYRDTEFRLWWSLLMYLGLI